MISIVTASMFFPLIGAVVANFASRPENRIDLALDPRLMGNAKNYLIGWFAPTVVTVLGCVVFFAVNPRLFSLQDSPLMASLQQSGMTADQAPPLIAVTIASAIVVAPFINMVFALGEEVGWRGMLFPTLAERMPPRSAALTSSIIWGLWHAPIIAMGHNYGMGYPGFPITGMLMMMLFCAPLGICLAWLRIRSGSVWTCALAHGAFNAIAGVGLYFCTTGSTLLGPSPLGLIAGIPLLVLGIICFVKFPQSNNTKPES